MAGSWFSMLLVPKPRELGLRTGSRSHPFPCPHAPDRGKAGGLSPPQGRLQQSVRARGTPALFLHQQAAMGSVGKSTG